ncbi:hypothetical protein B0T26DRAFT_657703 [Lasiosphaeria miniovina]|uniref:DUF4604 domain-containing protein n=1 Tax=Lasiosphaeria miniovina TaxID=1954250 RepID=A0AA39ZUM7_9PEZI|nr:uncharacterized protein B0T26DRAFT_657703 [Lasiosphaeria miniovina]KAK0704012.1 hypothetical protein B0T26DRAFT_657703 [Lasiosphaeria miniovina]
MSGKITSKNLHYNSRLPPFLARLHGEAASGSDGPDPILAAQRRPTKAKRSGSEEAEDAPLVVDERGHTVDGLDVQFGADGAVMGATRTGTGEDEADAAQNGDVTATATATGPAAAAASKDVADGSQLVVGGAKKRKVGKVIGAHSDDDDGEGGGKDNKKTKQNKRADGSGTVVPAAGGDGAATKPKKPNKKAKKIKLSFGDDEG